MVDPIADLDEAADLDQSTAKTKIKSIADALKKFEGTWKAQSLK